MNNLIYNTQYLFQHFLKERNCEYFNIPEYQRGYKWTSNNVMQLLDDLYNFSKKRNNEEFYCLQNITLTKESVEGKTYMNVIDGQQRLTTLFIILSFMQRNLADKIIPVDSNIFKYSVRDSTNKFLKEKIQTGYLWMSDIEPNDAESKDQFYIMEVAKSVKEWFDNHPNELYPDIILNHIKLIVNEVKSGEEETVFASLNGGKVDLDGADLVRAILITRAARQKYPTIISQKTINQFTNDDIDFNINIKVSSNGKIHEYRVKLGVEIDKMNLWWSQKDVRAYFEQLLPNRIERNRSFNYSDYPIDLLYYAFFEAFKSTLFNEQEKNRDLNLKHFENGIDFNSRPGDDHLELYNELQELHLTLVDWYNDPEIYNLVGYLMYNFKSDIITFELLYKIWKDAREKADFKEKIKRLIRYQLASLYGEMERGEINFLSILNGDINEALEENLRNLRKDILNTSTMNWCNSDITLKLLPLLDILPHTIQKGKKTNKVIKPLKQQYFKRTPSEDKEHVRSQTRQLDEESMTQEDVELLIEENRRGLNSIGNIVLLHESINKSYKNKKLIMKMVRIYSEHLMDDVNAYIRPHTLDVFMSKMRNINENGIDEDEIFWSDEDIKRTAISIDSSLADYLSFPELTDNKKWRKTVMTMDKLNIKELLEGFNFVVPEIQREYVWGAAKNKRVLIQFLKDLDQKLSQGDANIGFLYSYKSGAEHYLIDGQQRYTTILLLCYYLAVDEGKDNLAHFIDMLKLNQNIQAFSYRVRSYTESFLQNLFKSGIKNADAVTDQTWYKRNYEDDTTITSMIGALSVFEAELKNCSNIQLERILNHVTFWYFDVDMTSQGEELYITMNSRGEKLTDSEQIKPRLLKVSAKKEFYGKKWDDWEEFFYNKQLRGKRNIDSIDTAMNNMIRIVLELKTLHEHSRINPVEDAELITIEDIAKYMNAIIELYEINDGNYILEIARLYGDSKEDGDFYVLKALLTERLKDKKDLYEYERVYQTVKNHVRRNKLKNLPFLTFLKEYKESSKEWYDYILTEKESSSNVFNGHELEKINICNSLGYSAEKAIWELQSHPFWNGEIKQMINWSKLGESFSLKNFKINSQCFNLLFDQKQDVGWTSDSVRQALIAYLPKYPLDDCFFGFTSSQWKEIMYNNSDRFQQFLQLFIDMTQQERNAKLDEIKSSYDEKPENKWAEFVQHDYLLEYCNTKRIQYRNEYGIECVQNCYKQPVSVKNMHLYHYLKSHLNEKKPLSNGWICWMDKSGWKSVIKIYNDNYPFRFHIQYRKDHNEQYKIKLIWNGDSLSEEERNLVETVGFIREEERYVFYVSLDMSNSLNVIRQIVIAYDVFLANR